MMKSFVESRWKEAIIIEDNNKREAKILSQKNSNSTSRINGSNSKLYKGNKEVISTQGKLTTHRELSKVQSARGSTNIEYNSAVFVTSLPPLSNPKNIEKQTENKHGSLISKKLAEIKSKKEKMIKQEIYDNERINKALEDIERKRINNINNRSICIGKNVALPI